MLKLLSRGSASAGCANIFMDIFMFQLRDEFNTTKKMSTYLLAFVICDFSVETKRTPTNNINVSVIAAPDKIDQTEFALKAAVELTDYYEEYFGINYPLPKQVLFNF